MGRAVESGDNPVLGMRLEPELIAWLRNRAQKKYGRQDRVSEVIRKFIVDEQAREREIVALVRETMEKLKVG